ncbi:hypothetical protein A2755_00160 [Candidatus Wolfebacteria bacterium RIFCSPHIGHO2_01_FULL_48_22]|uniref:Uncharacterized protein n=1 Tax=Candidatus Wolfebacteria bacterium RIFCSPHIGHO2_01_FULL_48_22 TaxID=1802555 RepID=A0A1F8DSA7_9BACT|nr:MAG: hypothetical protein A2755_00160 [Candidatus Wolfebacteria bacterium RIFCSPHIGHO2_01_FULL_48_22]
MGFLSKILGKDYESEKIAAFAEIGRQFVEAEKINQAKAGWLTMRGNNHSMRRRFDLAIADFTEALKFEPNRPFTLISLGGAYAHTGNYKEAITILESAKKYLEAVDATLRNISEHNLYSELGSAYFFADKKQEAVVCLTKSLEAVEKQRALKNTGAVSEEEWEAQQKMIAPMIKNAEWLLARIKL